MSNKLGFMGCGEMASAIIKGLLSAGFMHTSDIHATTHTDKSASAKSKILKIKVITNNKEIAKDSEIIVLATKPNKIEAIVDKSPVVRVMPNTPMLVSEGMCGICLGKLAGDSDEKFVTEMLSQVGKVVTVTEEQIDVVTAISGSGPAFFYQIFEDFAQAGAKLGLDYQKSLTLALQTAIGSAKMVQNSTKPVPELVASVATKGGCTEVGVSEMKSLDSSNLFAEVVRKTAEKAHALG